MDKNSRRSREAEADTRARTRFQSEEAREMSATAQEMADENRQAWDRLGAVQRDHAAMRERIATGRSPERIPEPKASVERPVCATCGHPRDPDEVRPCPHCGTGAWERAQLAHDTAQQHWAEAQETHTEAQHEHTEAAAAWEQARADWASAQTTWTTAEATFAQAEAAAHQSEIEWEGARSNWDEAERIHELQEHRRSSP